MHVDSRYLVGCLPKLKDIGLEFWILPILAHFAHTLHNMMYIAKLLKLIFTQHVVFNQDFSYKK